MDKEIRLNKENCNYLDVARTLVIYLVVLGHMPYTGINAIYRDIIYAFHMPFFFMISGILHKEESFSFKSLKRIFISLIIPYYIYNVICAIVYYPINHNSILDSLLDIVLCMGKQPSGASWFFLSLFFIKVVALFMKNKFWYIIIAFLCVIYLYEVKDYSRAYMMIFRIKPAIAAFPFFTFGFLFKSKLNINGYNFTKISLIILGFIFIYLYASRFGRANPSTGVNIAIIPTYIAGIMGSVSMLFLSQYLFPLLKSDIIKTLSRGTMIIVALHGLATTYFVKYYPNLGFRYSIFISIIIILIFYPIIKTTYNRIPILYGKMKTRK